jgi:hypothetical protein
LDEVTDRVFTVDKVGDGHFLALQLPASVACQLVLIAHESHVEVADFLFDDSPFLHPAQSL